MRIVLRVRAWTRLIALLLGSVPAEVFAATDDCGRVAGAGVAVPGATVTASQGDTRVMTAETLPRTRTSRT